MRFLDVTLDTYQDTSGYMYLGLFITIHQDTPRYKITIHVRARDTYPRMYPYVSDMYRECILCVMYLRVKIHCILNVS
jgi:hypothetical protein